MEEPIAPRIDTLDESRYRDLIQKNMGLQGKILTVDLHIDTPWKFTKYGPFYLAEGAPYSKVSLPKMKDGRLDRAIFVVYLPDYVQDALGPRLTGLRVEGQLSWIGKGVPFALEGARLLGTASKGSSSLLSKPGLKYLTLTHNKANVFADSSKDRPYHGGLSKLGAELIVEAENKGILIDLSHASDQTCECVLKVASRPVIASHSGCRAIVDHVRNLPDYLIEGIADTGGLIGVPFARSFVGPGKSNVIDHIEHLIKVVGVEHVAIGSDLDGAAIVDGVEDVSDWGSLVIDGLKERGFEHKYIIAIAGGNAARLLHLQ